MAKNIPEYEGLRQNRHGGYEDYNSDAHGRSIDVLGNIMANSEAYKFMPEVANFRKLVKDAHKKWNEFTDLRIKAHDAYLAGQPNGDLVEKLRSVQDEAEGFQAGAQAMFDHWLPRRPQQPPPQE